MTAEQVDTRSHPNDPTNRHLPLPSLPYSAAEPWPPRQVPPCGNARRAERDRRAEIAGQFVILDAREQKQYDEGRLPGAVWVDVAVWAKAFKDGGCRGLECPDRQAGHPREILGSSSTTIIRSMSGPHLVGPSLLGCGRRPAPERQLAGLEKPGCPSRRAGRNWRRPSSRPSPVPSGWQPRGRSWLRSKTAACKSWMPVPRASSAAPTN